MSRRRLPPGPWIRLEDLDPSTSDRELQLFLRKHGVEISIAHIAIERPGSAVICLQQNVLADLLKKLFGDDKLRDHTPVPEPYSWDGIR